MTYEFDGKSVGPVGYGMMGLTLPPANPTVDQCIVAIKTAVDSGCTYINASEFYGTPEKNSLTVLRAYVEKYPEDADKIVLNLKGTADVVTMEPQGSKEDTARSIDRSLNLLGPNLRVAQFEPARKDPKVDFEKDTLATINRYVEEGKVGGLALSEIGPETLGRLVKNHKIQALEIEFSLFRLDPITNGTFEICAEHNIPILAYSPLGRGILGGNLRSPDDLPEGDIRRFWPQFAPENFDRYLKLASQVEAIANRKGCTPGQVAIGWILNLSKQPGMPKIIPIPGSSNPDRIKENATVIELSSEDVAEISNILKEFKPAEGRYPPAFSAVLDG